MKIVFMGTADLAATVLQALVEARQFEILAAVSQPDKPKGRDLKLQPTPVKEMAGKHGLPVLQPARARDPGFLEQVRALAPELIVVAAYGQILPQALLDIPRHGCLNVHTSLLPRHRGAAPIQWAILDGDEVTGVTIMKMDAGLDTGAIVSQETTPIRAEDNAQTLHDRLAELGGALLIRTIPEFVTWRTIPQPQPAEGVTYARKITKEDGRLDWAKPARTLWNRVRGLTPWPGTFAYLSAAPASEPGATLSAKPVLLKVWNAEVAQGKSAEPGTVVESGPGGLVIACGEGALRLIEVQREGGRRITAQQFLAGHPMPPGTRLY